MRSTALLALVAALVIAHVQIAGAEEQASPQPSSQPAAAAAPAALSDQEIRDALVGKSYVEMSGRNEMTIELNANGTASGSIEHGWMGGNRRGGGSAYDSDSGTYKIENGKLCLAFTGAWSAKDGKPRCREVTKDAKTYFLGSKPIRILPGK